MVGSIPVWFPKFGIWELNSYFRFKSRVCILSPLPAPLAETEKWETARSPLFTQHDCVFSSRCQVCSLQGPFWSQSFSPHKILIWSPNPQSDGIRWWTLRDVIRAWVWKPHKWNYCPYKRCGYKTLPLQSCDYTRKNSTVWDLKQALSRIGPSWHPDLRIPDSRTVSNTFLLFTNYPVYAILLKKPEQWNLAWSTVSSEYLSGVCKIARGRGTSNSTPFPRHLVWALSLLELNPYLCNINSQWRQW